VARVREGTAKHLDTAHHDDECRNATVIPSDMQHSANSYQHDTLLLATSLQSIYRGVGRGMDVLDAAGDRRRGRGSLEVNVGHPIVTNGDTVV